MSIIASCAASLALVPWLARSLERSVSIPIVRVRPDEQSPLLNDPPARRLTYVTPAPAPIPTMSKIRASARETVLFPGADIG